MKQIVRQIRKDLESSADARTRETSKRFFKEEIKVHGVKASIVSNIGRKYWREIKRLGKQDIFHLCEELLRSDYTEEAALVSLWIPKLKEQFQREDLQVFERWIERYINNWAKCDAFCNHTVGDFIDEYPDCIEKVKEWTASPNRWMRRAAAVSLILPARRGRLLSHVLDIADRLLVDEDDLVQKGYGWMLKEASREHQQEIFDYVIRNKMVMPRTALRYAIELMPDTLRKEAMRK